MHDLQRQADLELLLERLTRELRDQAPRLQQAQQRHQLLLQQMHSARQRRDEARTRLNGHLANAKVPELELTARMATHRTFTAWLRVASKQALNVRSEVREFLAVIADLALAGGAVRAKDKGYSPERLKVYSRLEGYQHAYRMLASGAPAAAVTEYLKRLRDDPAAKPPALPERDLKQGVSVTELGYRSDADAYDFLGSAALALSASPRRAD